MHPQIQGSYRTFRRAVEVVIVLIGAIGGKVVQFFVRNVMAGFLEAFPDRLAGWDRGRRRRFHVLRLTAICATISEAHLFLQPFERCLNKGKDGFACLLGQRDKQGFLFRRQFKWCCFHNHTVSRTPNVCKKSYGCQTASRCRPNREREPCQRRKRESRAKLQAALCVVVQTDCQPIFRSS